MSAQGRRSIKLFSLLTIVFLLVTACGGNTPTVVPATSAPATAAPATSAPATAAPATSAPATESAATTAPTQPPLPTTVPATTAATAAPVTLVIARAASDSINPVSINSTEAAENVDMVYESLVYINDQETIIPSLATSWEHSADYSSWTFHLRQGVKFHDGTPFNAQAVKYNLDRLLRVPGQSGGAWTTYADTNTVQIADDYTVMFNLKAPFPGLVVDMLYARYLMASPTYLKANATPGDPEAMQFMATHEAGTGPFRLVEFVPDQRTVFEKNPDYWGGSPGGKSLPKVDQVIFQIIKDPDTARVELEAGRVDIIESPAPAQLTALASSPGITLTASPVPKILYLTMDVSHPPFDDANVRRAVASAINYDELRSAGEQGYAFPQCGITPQGLSDFLPPDPSLCLYPYNLDQAKAFMAKSAYPKGFTVDLTFAPERNPGFAVESQLLQSYLAQIGIMANVQSLAVTAQVAKMAQGSYGLAMFAWNAGIPDPDDYFGWLYDQGRLPTTDSWVASFWNDAQVEADMRKARGLTDPAARKALYQAADLKAMQLAIYIPLFQGSKIFAHSDKVQGLVFTLFRRLNIWDITKQ